MSALLEKWHFGIDNQLVTKIAFLRKRANSYIELSKKNRNGRKKP